MPRRKGPDLKRREETAKRYRVRHKWEMAARQRRWLYGISDEDFKRLLVEQADRCAACLKPMGDGDHGRY
jgi:hypothetical protein